MTASGDYGALIASQASAPRQAIIVEPQPPIDRVGVRVPDGPVSAAQAHIGRVLSVGDVLDESVRVYRRHFISFALVSAITLLPSGVVLVGTGALGLTSASFSASDFAVGGRFGGPGSSALNAQLQRQAAAAAGVFGVSILFGLWWSAAVLLASDRYLRGHEIVVREIVIQAGARLPGAIAGSVLLGAGLAACLVVAGALFVLTGFGLVGSFVASVGLLVWWLRPTRRRRWLKWLIVLTAPFGLPTYFGFRWAMYLAAVVLERHGPLAALRRSSQLTAGWWFRVATVLTLAPLIVGILAAVLASLVNVPLGVVAADRGEVGLGPTASAVSYAVNLVLQILFASVAAVAYTLLFHDLRNRREGTDLVERLIQLEALPLAASG